VSASTADTDRLAVIWHDLECGGYDLDLPLWRELAEIARGPILDVGAGTGRVTLDLARAGHAVVALDREPALLRALAERAAGLSVQIVRADARDFDLGRRFGLILVPMQTVQLLGGAAGRARFLRCARTHLAAGGVLAVALADALESFDEEHDQPPLPDMRDIDGVIYASRPVAVRDEGSTAAIHRVREVVDRRGGRSTQDDVIHLDRVSPAGLAAEGAEHGLRPLPARRIAQTEEYVGSTVVMLGG
jgi:SAM-dependent methyltransferase